MFRQIDIQVPLYQKEYSLTVGNLLELGVLDVFYDTYFELKEYYDNEIRRWEDERGDSPDPYTINLLCFKKTRQILEELISSQSHVFVSGESIVHVDESALLYFQFEDYSEAANFKHAPKPMTFEQFLIGVQEIVVELIEREEFKKNEGTRAVISMDEKFNKRINNLVDAKRHRRIVNSDSPFKNTDETLWIFERLSQTSCYRKNHPIEAASYIADVLEKPDRIRLPVHYCPLCNKYFIGKTTLELYDDLYGKILADRRYMGPEDGFDEFRPEPKLHQLGYNVISGNMSTDERHTRLIYLLRTNKISYVEMCTTIEQDINLFRNSDRHWNAVKKWKDDLLFIGDWMKENSRSNEENR